MLNDNDKETLRKCYDDYRASVGGNIGAFPFKSLDDFLVNLDGGKNKRGDHIGSSDWRYFLIEEKRSQKMPRVSVDYLHEIVYGCIRIIECVKNGHTEPGTCTHSWRMRWEREKKYREWFRIRMNTDGWDDLGDRLEILWGPDYLGRYDFYLFQGDQIKDCFTQIPDDIDLPIVDKRNEIESFDVKKGVGSIEITSESHPFTEAHK